VANRFASGKYAIAECDRCGFRYKLKQLKAIFIKGKHTNILVCPICYEKDHPQLRLGLYPVDDPQALRNPRPDQTRFPESESRSYQFGFNPVGLSNTYNLNIKNNLLGSGVVGTVTVTTT
tara:strand:+ start:1187 stop:1546 length:360 start_codon:yes stop_codon:yes gene_type:complete